MGRSILGSVRAREQPEHFEPVFGCVAHLRTAAFEFCLQRKIIRHDDIAGFDVSNHEAFTVLVHPHGDEKAEAGVETVLVAFLRIEFLRGFRKPLSNFGRRVRLEERGSAFTDESPVAQGESFCPLRIVFRQYACHTSAGLEPFESN